MGRLPLLLFDALFVFFAVVVYGPALAVAFYVGERVYGPSILERVAAVLVGYAVFLHAFIAMVAVVKRIVQPRLHEGFCKVGLNKKYFAWALNSIFQALFTTSFFDRQVHLVFYLKVLYYRAMGMKLPYNAVIGTRAVIRQAELIELGDKVVLGEMSGLYGHVSPDGRRHFQGKIRIGDGSVVGAYAVIGPDVVIGAGSVVGSSARISPMVRIGRDVDIGVGVIVPSKANVPDGVQILSGSVIEPGTKMSAGETWGGNPARRIDRKLRRVSAEPPAVEP